MPGVPGASPASLPSHHTLGADRAAPPPNAEPAELSHLTTEGERCHPVPQPPLPQDSQARLSPLLRGGQGSGISVQRTWALFFYGLWAQAWGSVVRDGTATLGPWAPVATSDLWRPCQGPACPSCSMASFWEAPGQGSQLLLHPEKPCVPGSKMGPLPPKPPRGLGPCRAAPGELVSLSSWSSPPAPVEKRLLPVGCGAGQVGKRLTCARGFLWVIGCPMGCRVRPPGRTQARKTLPRAP